MDTGIGDDPPSSSSATLQKTSLTSSTSLKHAYSALHSESARRAGWLAVADLPPLTASDGRSRAPPLLSWRRQWAYLLPDRLCHGDGPGATHVTYLPLDRVSPRPMPRGYAPAPGIARVDPRSSGKIGGGVALPAGAAAAFSVTVGDSTTVFATDSEADADGWVREVEAAWEGCVREAVRSVGGVVGVVGAGGSISASASASASATFPAAASSSFSSSPPSGGGKTSRYSITVVTGALPGCGTEGEPTVELHGKAASTGGGASATSTTTTTTRVRLPALRGDLDAGRAATYAVELPTVSPLTAVTVSLRAAKSGAAGGGGAANSPSASAPRPWLLDRVEVSTVGSEDGASSSSPITFPCGRWIAAGDRVTLLPAGINGGVAAVETAGTDVEDWLLGAAAASSSSTSAAAAAAAASGTNAAATFNNNSSYAPRAPPSSSAATATPRTPRATYPHERSSPSRLASLRVPPAPSAPPRSPAAHPLRTSLSTTWGSLPRNSSGFNGGSGSGAGIDRGFRSGSLGSGLGGSGSGGSLLARSPSVAAAAAASSSVRAGIDDGERELSRLASARVAAEQEAASRERAAVSDVFGGLRSDVARATAQLAEADAALEAAAEERLRLERLLDETRREDADARRRLEEQLEARRGLEAELSAARERVAAAAADAAAAAEAAAAEQREARALAEALDAARRDASAAEASLAGSVEAARREAALAEEARAAAEAALRGARAEVQAAEASARSARLECERQAAQAAAAAAAADAASADALAARQALGAADAAVSDARGDALRSRAEAEGLRPRLAVAERDAALARERAAAAEAAAFAARGDADEARAALERVGGERARLEGVLAGLREGLDEASARIDGFQAQLAGNPPRVPFSKTLLASQSSNSSAQKAELDASRIVAGRNSPTIISASLPIVHARIEVSTSAAEPGAGDVLLTLRGYVAGEEGEGGSGGLVSAGPFRLANGGRLLPVSADSAGASSSSSSSTASASASAAAYVVTVPQVDAWEAIDLELSGGSPSAGWKPSWVKIAVSSPDGSNSGGENNTFLFSKPPPAFFPCDRWLRPGGRVSLSAVSESLQLQQQQQQQTQQQQPQQQITPDPLAAAGYRVTFHTSPFCVSGTRARVAFELVGERGRTGAINPPQTPAHFRRGGADAFTYPLLPGVGRLTALRLSTDGRGAGLLGALTGGAAGGAGWHVAAVEVVHLATGTVTRFPCHAFVDRKCGFSRTLAPVGVGGVNGSGMGGSGGGGGVASGIAGDGGVIVLSSTGAGNGNAGGGVGNAGVVGSGNVAHLLQHHSGSWAAHARAAASPWDSPATLLQQQGGPLGSGIIAATAAYVA